MITGSKLLADSYPTKIPPLLKRRGKTIYSVIHIRFTFALFAARNGLMRVSSVFSKSISYAFNPVFSSNSATVI